MEVQILPMENKSYGINNGTQIGKEATFTGSVTFNNTSSKVKSLKSFNPSSFKTILGLLIEHYDKLDSGELKLNLEPEDFLNKRDMNRKNEINRMDEIYYNKVIVKDLKDNFDDIKSFLENIRNNRVSRKYATLARQLTGNYIAHREKFSGIHEHIQNLVDELINSLTETDHEDIGDYVAVILHHMYWMCDYGEEVDKYDNTK